MSSRMTIALCSFALAMVLASCGGSASGPQQENAAKEVQVIPLKLTTEYTVARITELIRLGPQTSPFIASSFRIVGASAFGFESPALSADGALEVKIFKANDAVLNGKSVEAEVRTVSGQTVKFNLTPSFAREMVVTADPVLCGVGAPVTRLRFTRQEFPESSPYAQLIQGELRASNGLGFTSGSFVHNSSMSYTVTRDVNVRGPLVKGIIYEADANFKVWRATSTPDRLPALIYNFKVNLNCI